MPNNETTAQATETSAEAPKHTPGPWRVLDGAILSRKLNDYGNYLVASLDREETAQDKANLALIAAAPELLAAVRAVQAGFADGSIKWAKPRQADSDAYHPANTAMCAAIARAKGRTA